MVRAKETEEKHGGSEQKQASELEAALTLPGLLWLLSWLLLWVACGHPFYSGFLLTR
jgi:hypothetical protein